MKKIFKVALWLLVAVVAICIFFPGQETKSSAADAPVATAKVASPATQSPVATSITPTPSTDDSSDSAASATPVADQEGPATLSDAIAQYLPDMADTADEPSKGAAELTVWSIENLTWKELAKQPKTRPALVMKDSDNERGKLICASGQIVEIKAENALSTKIFEGEVADEDQGAVYRFVAVKSTGELVQGDPATFCGIVIGRFDYSNSDGGVAHAIQLVGMFKLPENVKATHDLKS